MIANAIGNFAGGRRAGVNWSAYWATRTPSSLILTVLTDTSIKLDWTANGVEDYDGYSVERSADGVTYAEVDTVVVGTETYTDAGLTPYSLYYYRVRAYRGTNYSSYSNVDADTTLYPSVLNDSDKIGFFDFEVGVHQSDGNLTYWSDIGGDSTYADLYPTGAVTVEIDGIQNANTALMSGKNSLVSPIAQPVFLYALVNRQDTNAWLQLIGASSGAFGISTGDSGDTVRAQAGTYSGKINMSNNEWHILRCYLNGASSKLIVDDGAPVIWNCGSNALNKLFLGTEGAKWKIAIWRKSNVGETEIYNYLLKRKMSSINQFLQKYYTKTMNDFNQLNIVLAGDSIFGRMYSTQMSYTDGQDVGLYPPNMWQQNVSYKLLNSLQYDNADVVYSNLQAWTKSANWEAYLGNDGQRLWITNNLNDYAEITIRNARYFKILYYTPTVSDNEITILINGVAPSSLNITGGDSFITKNGGIDSDFYKWGNTVLGGFDPKLTYTIRIINTGGHTSYIWGCESWENKRVNIITSALGGSTSAMQLARLNNIYGLKYDPDLIIMILSCLNDSYSVHDKGGRATTSPSIDAVEGDYFFALNSGVFTNYNGLELTIGDYAEYDGTKWVAGSSIVDTKILEFNTSITYIDSIIAYNVPFLFILPHKITTENNKPLLTTFKGILKSKLLNLSIDYIDMDDISFEWNLITDLADGTHLNDISAGYYYDEIMKYIYNI